MGVLNVICSVRSCFLCVVMLFVFSVFVCQICSVVLSLLYVLLSCALASEENIYLFCRFKENLKNRQKPKEKHDFRSPLKEHTHEKI